MGECRMCQEITNNCDIWTATVMLITVYFDAGAGRASLLVRMPLCLRCFPGGILAGYLVIYNSLETAQLPIVLRYKCSWEQQSCCNVNSINGGSIKV